VRCFQPNIIDATFPRVAFGMAAAQRLCCFRMKWYRWN